MDLTLRDISPFIRSVLVVILAAARYGCGGGEFFVEGDTSAEDGQPQETQDAPPDNDGTDDAVDTADVTPDVPPGDAVDPDLPAEIIDLMADPDLDLPSDPDADSPAELPPPGINTISTSAAGYPRTYLLYIPTGLATPAPLLVALHGNGDTADNFFAYSRLQTIADGSGVLVAVPQAISGSGPYGVDWDSYGLPASGNKDHQLIVTIIDEVSATGAIDTHRVFLLGYSQGGFMAFYSAMTLADRLGAVHVQSAGDPMLGGPLVSDAPRQIPVDLLIGSLDSLLSVAQDTRDGLQGAGFPVRYEEVPGHGHCCFLYDRVGDIWGWLASNPLP